jgi:SAM-dependent methyltransferase
MERPLYRAGRVAAVAGLALRPGDRVLDVGCGTGLNFSLLVAAVGGSGEVVGVDASAAMLRQARRRIGRRWWGNVSVVGGDAAALGSLLTGPFDAVLFAYSLAVVDDWRQAWLAALGLRRRAAGRDAQANGGHRRCRRSSRRRTSGHGSRRGRPGRCGRPARWHSRLWPRSLQYGAASARREAWSQILLPGCRARSW